MTYEGIGSGIHCVGKVEYIKDKGLSFRHTVIRDRGSRSSMKRCSDTLLLICASKKQQDISQCVVLIGISLEKDNTSETTSRELFDHLRVSWGLLGNEWRSLPAGVLH